MGIIFAPTCDRCQDKLYPGDDCYCSTCYEKLEKEISGLEDEIARLSRELEEALAAKEE